MIDRLWDLPHEPIGPVIGLFIITVIAIWSWRDRRQH